MMMLQYIYLYHGKLSKFCVIVWYEVRCHDHCQMIRSADIEGSQRWMLSTDSSGAVETERTVLQQVAAMDPCNEAASARQARL